MAAVRYLYKLLNYSTMKKKFKKEEMQFENELLKLKASAEFGATIHSEGTAPPEIENQFLKNVFEFERAWKDMKTVKVFDFIGKPEIKKSSSVKKNMLPIETEKLLAVLAEHNIEVDCICEVDDRDFYKFLSEELMDHEMNDFKAEGWTTHYTYEEFHPNDEHDLHSLTKDFIESILSREWDFYETYLDKKIKTKKEKFISKREAISKIEAFRKSFDRFEKRQISIDELLFTKKKASVKATVSYNATLDANQIQFDGEAFLKFKLGEFGWDVSEFSMPGLTI